MPSRTIEVELKVTVAVVLRRDDDELANEAVDAIRAGGTDAITVNASIDLGDGHYQRPWVELVEVLGARDVEPELDEEATR